MLERNTNIRNRVPTGHISKKLEAKHANNASLELLKSCEETLAIFPAARPQPCEDGQPEKVASVAILKQPKHAEKNLLVHITIYAATFLDLIDDNASLYQRFVVDQKTREFVSVLHPQEIVQIRYRLANIVREILMGKPHPRGEGCSWRTVFCMRCLLPEAEYVAGMLSKEHQRAFFKNLKACGLVWACPHCAPKITQRRKEEIKQAADTHIAAGGAMYMVTLTFSHSKQDVLADLLGHWKLGTGLLGALRRLNSHRAYKELCKSLGYVGSVRAKEITYGHANGWHPHPHDLMFFEKALTASELAYFSNTLFDLWHRACKASGLALPTREHGVNVVRAYSPAEYLQKWGHEQKWGAGAELTQLHTKKSKNHTSYTPMDFLRQIDAGNPLAWRFKELYLEFVTASYGTRQLTWSPGLKKRFGIGELTDQQIAEQEEDKADLVVSVHKKVWYRLLKLPVDHRPRILWLIQNGGKAAVDAFLASVCPQESQYAALVEFSHAVANDWYRIQFETPLALPYWPVVDYQGSAAVTACPAAPNPAIALDGVVSAVVEPSPCCRLRIFNAVPLVVVTTTSLLAKNYLVMEDFACEKRKRMVGLG